MTTFELGGRAFRVERASEADLPDLARLLADDVLGSQRESTDLERYAIAFREIDRDPNHFLVAVRDAEDDLVGTMQLTLIPGLARAGAKRLQIEGVRLASSTRGMGLGTALFTWAHEYGRRQGASLAQLTTDKTRTDAHRFYDTLGYEATHEGYKRPL
ncbi:GNAT family N-acetyltransferase [Alloalcanivorax gelatiniphagus]